MLLASAWFGTMMIDTDGKVMDFQPAPKDAAAIAKRLLIMKSGGILDDEEAIANRANESRLELTVSEQRLRKFGNYEETHALDLARLASERGYDRALLHDATIELARIETRASIGGDKQVIQAVNAIDDLSKSANLLSERLHEWYGMHFPEFAERAKEDEFVGLIAAYGDRDAVAAHSSLGIDATRSVGASLSPSDMDAIMDFAKCLKNIYSTKDRMEKYIGERMDEIAPNLAKLAGPIIGARLISLTGGLERLSLLPASAVQLLGAEKALFRHLREGENPPKYGVIFQHTLIHKAPYWQRGKIARAFAGKVAIAAKVDAHSGNYIADELQADLDRRIAEIAKQHPNEPKGKMRIIEQPKPQFRPRKFRPGFQGRPPQGFKKKGKGKQKWFAKKGKR